MKSVRFTQVVSKSGKPEIYLLLSKDDKTFQNALKQDRIMSLVGGTDGAKTQYGLVGYDEKRHGQLLLFPRSLKAFSDSHIVGIKFDLLNDDRTTSSAKKKSAEASPSRKPEAKPKPQPPATAKPIKAKKENHAEKVIPFPKAERNEDIEEELSVEQMKALSRQALRALEKNNTVAAYKLLQRMISE